MPGRSSTAQDPDVPYRREPVDNRRRPVATLRQAWLHERRSEPDPGRARPGRGHQSAEARSASLRSLFSSGRSPCSGVARREPGHRGLAGSAWFCVEAAPYRVIHRRRGQQPIRQPAPDPAPRTSTSTGAECAPSRGRRNEPVRSRDQPADRAKQPHGSMFFDEIDAQREAAWRRGRPDLLAHVYLAGTTALGRDRAMLAGLPFTGVAGRGRRLRFLSVAVVQPRPDSVGPARRSAGPSGPAVAGADGRRGRRTGRAGYRIELSGRAHLAIASSLRPDVPRRVSETGRRSRSYPPEHRRGRASRAQRGAGSRGRAGRTRIPRPRAVPGRP